MKKAGFLIIFQLMGIAVHAGAYFAENNDNTNGLIKKTFTYSNPADFSYQYFNGRREVTVKEVRDPVIIREGDTYYLTYNHYPFTHHLDRDPDKPDYNSSPGLKIYKSNDLQNWEFVDWLIKSSELPEKCVYKHRFWAPEIHKINERFYLVFYADNWIKEEYNLSGRMGYEVFIGVADRITGPYTNFSWLEGGACDTSIFQDEDGKTYAIMPFGGDQYLQEVNLSGIDQRKIFLTGKREKVVSHDYSSIGKVSPAYLEGPWMIKRNGKYMLFSAANYRQPESDPVPGFEYGYWVDVAIADNIWGPYEIHPQIFIGGHIGTFIGPDGKDWFSYRGEWRDHPGWAELNIDPVPINTDGTVFKAYPAHGMQTVEYWVDESTGINPLPIKFDLTLQYQDQTLTIASSTEVIQTVDILNLQGQLAFSDINVHQTSFSVSISLPPGMYIAKVKRATGLDILKFIHK